MLTTLDEGVEVLERQVRALTEIVAGKKAAPDWRGRMSAALRQAAEVERDAG